MGRTRRDVLVAGTGAVATSLLAGCVNGGGSSFGGPDADDSTGYDGYASFFTLYDFARHVGGDVVSFENAVPVGQHGHAWEPRVDLVPQLAESDVFVYLGVDGFQRWADDARRNIEAEGAPVELIDATDGVELLPYGDGDHDEDDHNHDDHENGANDPHFWLDPLAAQAAVRAIEAGLVAFAPDHADAFETNADEYVARLDTLHDAFETSLADRTHDLVVVAGHDSYGYLADRYDFEIHTPVGVSPQAEPSAREIADTIDLVEERGIEYVLYDAFESSRLAETIVTETGVRDAVMLSSTESVTEAWLDRGWGYVEQMAEINLAALELALGAES